MEIAQRNFIARGDLPHLENIISILEQQRRILQSFFKALRLLEEEASDRNKRFRRLRRVSTMIQFVYQNSDVGTQCRRNTIASLDRCSRYLLFISHTPTEISAYKDESFGIMAEGLHDFITANPHRHVLIREAIVDDTQNMIVQSDGEEDLFFVAENPKRKRRKTASICSPSPRRSESPGHSKPAPMPSTTAVIAEGVLPHRRDQAHTEQSDPIESIFETPDWLARGMMLNITSAESGSQQSLDLVPFAANDPSWLSRGIDLQAELWWDGELDEQRS
ncbi:hypothetical protein NCS56_00141900 [Fusarium sp. Ph1]|nr:hypothetical protein NCS56_00141900 [Fusarium sp. Ph1]